jgi:hypothetical protein
MSDGYKIISKILKNYFAVAQFQTLVPLDELN